MRNIDLSEFNNKSKALVLSGGVVKAAAWHLGVSLALEELGFEFVHNKTIEKNVHQIGTYVGSSAGALICLYFANGFRPIDIIEASIDQTNARLKAVSYRDMLKLNPIFRSKAYKYEFDPFDSFPGLIKKILNPLLRVSGFFTTDGLYQYLIENVIQCDRFEDLKPDLFIVATQLDHSRKVIFSKYNFPDPLHDKTSNYYTGIPISHAVSASMSVPPFYAPYPIKNPQTDEVDYYIDGEIRDTLSTHVATENGSELILSSWTHTPYHYHDEIGSLVNYGLPAICTQAIYLMIQKKIVASRMRRRNAKDLIDTVNYYMKDEKFNSDQIKNITEILEMKLQYNPNQIFIDIFPKHCNYNAFFKNSFSLNPNKMSELVTLGYKRTFEVFKRHEWK